MSQLGPQLDPTGDAVPVGLGATPLASRVARLYERRPDIAARDRVEYVEADNPKPHPSGHVCSAQSSALVAKQLDSRWQYAGNISRAERDRMRATRAVIDSPAGGKKSIPIWTTPKRLVLQCPYSGQLFLFRMS